MIRKFGKVVLWTLFLIALPMVAGAEDGSGGDGKWGYAVGAGLAFLVLDTKTPGRTKETVAHVAAGRARDPANYGRLADQAGEREWKNGLLPA